MWSKVSVAWEGRGRVGVGAGAEKDLHRDLPGVLTLHWMIAPGCRGTQACNLLVATI